MPTQRGRRLKQLLFGALLTVSSAAYGWSEETHQITGAMAWMDLAERNRPQLAELERLARSHPHYALFAPLAAKLTPAMRERALFEWLSRWPDDIRGGPDDNPEWHYELRVVYGRTWLWPFSNGTASEGFAANYGLLADPCAPEAERAKAIGWLIHIVGDIQQPLHAGHQITSDFNQSDRAGTLAFVRRSENGEPTDLHQYWDRILDRNVAAPPIQTDDWAASLQALWPRQKIAELNRDAALDDLFASYLDESSVLARLVAYQGTFLTAKPNAAEAPVVSARENTISRALAQRRVATSGYRIADILTRAIAEARANRGQCSSTGQSS